jgi:hypothetical protein
MGYGRMPFLSYLSEEELHRVTVVGDTRERVKDRAKESATSDVADATNVRVREDRRLVGVEVVTRLLDVRRWQAECVGPVVGELRVNILVDLDHSVRMHRKEVVARLSHIPEVVVGDPGTSDVTLNAVEERLGRVGTLAEGVRLHSLSHMVFECLKKNKYKRGPL